MIHTYKILSDCYNLRTNMNKSEKNTYNQKMCSDYTILFDNVFIY